MLAAAARRIPIRVYHMHGIRGMTAAGWRRRLLMTTERIACRLSTSVLCVSASTRRTAIDEGLCTPDKLVVLGAGSCNGIDARYRFDPGRFDEQARAATRARLNIPASAPVIGFVGRLVRDKGIGELASAWERLASEFPELHLILVGEEEAEDPVPAPAMATLREHPRVRFVRWVTDPAPYYAVMDVVALPTRREGMPYVPLEAAAMGLPVVATRVDGCVDAIVDGVTGTLVPPEAPKPLADALAVYLRDATLRTRHGAAGRQRVLSDFVPEDVWGQVLALYRALSGASA
jgi:glycosyltransferase involved in cell wall biosynthesis